MGSDHPVKTACRVRFLGANGCAYVRTKASHDQYRCPGCIRNILFRGREKDIPALHVRTSLRTMGIPYGDFLEWKKKNC